MKFEDGHKRDGDRVRERETGTERESDREGRRQRERKKWREKKRKVIVIACANSGFVCYQ